jgi:hypothetical protein
MQIDRRLNLVQTFDTNTGTVHIHSTPASYEVCRQYFLILRKTYAQMIAQGMFPMGGASAASEMMERIARMDNVWEGPEGVRDGLLAEIRRLTNVVVPGPMGWQTVPYDAALSQKMFDPEDIDEMEGAIIFFTCASLVFRSKKDRQRLEIILGVMESQWHTQSTSSDSMAWAASLPTSTPGVSIGETAPVSLIPH